MKIVINRDYGGFSLSKKACKCLGIDWEYDDSLGVRTDSRLIELVERDAESASGDCAALVVVEIPDNATDYELDEYDGLEEIIAVVDGKIMHI